MPLEDDIKQLTDAVNRNTAMMERLIQMRGDAIEAVKETAKPATKKADKPKADTKKADKPKADDEDKPQISANPEDRKPAEEEGGTAAKKSPHDMLAETIRAYLQINDDKADREARQGMVRKLFAHEKVCGNEKAKHTDVPEAMVPTVIANIHKLHEAEKKRLAEAENSSGDDEDLLG